MKEKREEETLEKLKDIDWKHNKINIIQNKTNNLNILPLTNEIGWAIIDYIKNSFDGVCEGSIEILQDFCLNELKNKLESDKFYE